MKDINKIFTSLKNNESKIIILIILLAAFVRIIKFNDIISFDSDQEFFAMEARSILVDHHPTLIGIPTQVGGVFIGPLFTYLATFFFLILNGNPNSTHVLTMLINLLTVPISYFVAKKLMGKRAGIITAIIVAFSKSSIIDGLGGWAVTPILGTTFLFVYFLDKFLKGEQKYFPLIMITIAVGLNWHIMSGFYLFVLIFSLIFFRKRPSLLYLLIGIASFVIILSPLVFFDLRHDFINTKNILSLFQNKTQVDVVKNFQKVISIAMGNAGSFLFTRTSMLSAVVISLIFLKFLNISLKDKKTILNKILLIFLGTVIFFASIYKGELSEYYLATLSAVFILIMAIVISSLSVKNIKYILIIFCIVNQYIFLTSTNSLSLKYKEQAISYIIKDSQDKNFILHIDSGHGQGSGFKYIFYAFKKEPTEKGDHLYLISIPWGQKKLTTTSLVVNNYKAENATYNIFGDIAVIKIY